MSKVAESIYIRNLKVGSYQAFNAIYGIYSNHLYGYCYRYTKSHEDAQDIVQEVFTSLWINRSMIRDENTVAHFLFQIAKNRLINKFRTQVNSPVYEEYVIFCNDSALSVDDTSRKVEFDDFCQLLEQIKGSLPVTQRNVYECCKEQGLSSHETAGLLGISEQTVKNQLSLALKVFRKRLERYKALTLLIGLF